MPFTVIEFWGKGDPFFGGTADDRPLGTSGRFLTGSYNRADVAHFETREHGLAAGEAAPNRRRAGRIGTIEDFPARNPAPAYQVAMYDPRTMAGVQRTIEALSPVEAVHKLFDKFRPRPGHVIDVVRGGRKVGQWSVSRAQVNPDLRVLCKLCGVSGEGHLYGGTKCPPTRGWGLSLREPKLALYKTDAQADAAWAKYLRKMPGTSYAPMS
jgi:hypothetical protein